MMSSAEPGQDTGLGLTPDSLFCQAALSPGIIAIDYEMVVVQILSAQLMDQLVLICQDRAKLPLHHVSLKSRAC